MSTLEITESEINSINNFNLKLLEEATRQAELIGSNEEARKNRVDKRAGWLFPVPLGIIALICTRVTPTIESLVTASITTIILVASLLCLFIALKPVKYGAAGTLPNVWLKPKLICKQNKESGNQILGRELALNLHSYHNVILENICLNNKRVSFFNAGLVLIIVSLIPMLLFFIYTVHIKLMS